MNNDGIVHTWALIFLPSDIGRHSYA